MKKDKLLSDFEKYTVEMQTVYGGLRSGGGTQQTTENCASCDCSTKRTDEGFVGECDCDKDTAQDTPSDTIPSIPLPLV